MCGIVGYVGSKSAAGILLNGLRRLEYRGYDSAGLAVQTEQGTLERIRVAGKVEGLSQAVSAAWADSWRARMHTGIAHTRWATHGAPTQANAHPHVDQNGSLALVHNGIIENYAVLRARLEHDGHAFDSETDSEVLAHLIGTFYSGSLIEAVSAALQHVVGAYGIAVLSNREPGRLVVARKGSPVAIGLGDGETLVASDPGALIAHTRRVIYLEDGDVAEITAGNVDIRNLQNMPVSRSVAEIDWDIGAIERGGHDHYMLKEIYEQPDALTNGIRGRLDDTQGTAILSGLNLTARDLAAVERVVLLGCGTSLHAAMLGDYFFEDLADLPTDVEQAAEFRYRNPIIGAHNLVVAISQSGETADTLAAVREAKQKGAMVAGLCNVVGSTIAREAGRGVYLHAGPEISVAATKAFTAQVCLLLMMALKFARGRRLSRQAGLDWCADIQRIPDLVRAVLAQQAVIAGVADSIAKAQHVFYIGRGYGYPVALEGALKLKEISYIHAEGYHAAELKHGPIALLEPGVPVVALAADVPGKDKTLSNMLECKARGAPVIAVATAGDADVAGIADQVIEIPASPVQTSVIPASVALQLLAYHVARLRGCPIDQPRNLAKSVTVE